MLKTPLILVFFSACLSYTGLAQNTEPSPAEVKKREEEMKKAQAEAEEARKKAIEYERVREEERQKRVKALLEMKSESSSGSAGIRLTKIPVTGVYYLGMKKQEYDSLSPLHPVTVKTEQSSYTFGGKTSYYKNRLYALDLELKDSLFSKDLPDLTAFYMSKLGDPDEKNIKDTVMFFPNEYGSGLQGEYRVKSATITWQYDQHKISINYRFTDLKNGAWNGFYHIQYIGSVEYVKSLAKLPD
ncbi:MAG: hypothetical protein ACO25B_09135 [Chitinophagaceae bacterium]